MEELKPQVEGQSQEGIRNSMDGEYCLMKQMSKDLLRDPKLFCSTLCRWIDLGWWRKHWVDSKQDFVEYETFKEFIEHTGVGGLGMWPDRQGKDFYLLVRAGIPGAEKIWLHWMEADAKNGAGLKGHGEIGNGRGKSRDGNLMSTLAERSACNSNEHVVARLIRDANDDKLSPDTQELCQSLLEEVRDGSRSIHSAALAASYRKKPSPEQRCLREFRKASDKLVVANKIFEALSDEQKQVFLDGLPREAGLLP